VTSRALTDVLATGVDDAAAGCGDAAVEEASTSAAARVVERATAVWRGTSIGPLAVRAGLAAAAGAERPIVARPREACPCAPAAGPFESLAEREEWLAPAFDAPGPESAAATPDPAHAATPNPTLAAPTPSHCRTAKPDDRRAPDFARLAITTPVHIADN